MTYTPYTATLSPVAAAQITLTEWRNVADAYAAQVTTRKASWEAAPDPERWEAYQSAIHQYRAARDQVRIADGALTKALEGSAHGRHAA